MNAPGAGPIGHILDAGETGQHLAALLRKAAELARSTHAADQLRAAAIDVERAVGRLDVALELEADE